MRSCFLAAPKLKDVRSWTVETREPRARVRKVAFSPDGALLAGGGDDGSVRVWEPQSHRLQRILLGHEGPICDLAWSPGGQRVATGSSDGTARLWDVSSGKCICVLGGHSGSVRQVDWSPDGNTVLTRSGHSIRIWNAQSGKLVLAQMLQDAVTHSAWSSDGTRLVTATGRRACIWDAEKGRLLCEMKHDPDWIKAVSWSSDNNLLASASGGGTERRIRIWNTDSGALLDTAELDADVVNIDFSPDSSMIAAGWAQGSKGGSSVWRIHKGKLEEIRKDGAGYTGGLGGIRVLWSPDGTRLARYNDGTVSLSIIEIESGKRLSRSEPVHAVDWSPDGESLAVVCGERGHSVAIWNGSLNATVQAWLGHEPVVRAVWSPTGAAIAASLPGDAHGVHVWSDAKEGNLSAFPTGTDAYLRGTMPWSPDGSRIAISSPKTPTQVWSVTGRDVQISLGSEANCLDCGWSPDGSKIVSCNASGTYRVWNALSGELLLTVKSELMDNRALSAWSPDGTMILLASGGKPVLYNASTGEQARTLELESCPSAFAWNPGGDSVAIASYEKNAKSIGVFDTSSGELIVEKPTTWATGGRYFRDSRNQNPLVTWSRDGKTVAYLAANRRIAFLKPETGQVTKHIRVPTANSSISPDMKAVAVPITNTIQLLQVEDGKPHGTLVVLRDKQALMIAPDGHYQGTSSAEEQIVYVVQTDHGQETLTPEEFSKRYGWKNDPGRVRLLGGGGSLPAGAAAKTKP